jgi:glycerol-3-phosphate acyltransferase PlsY
MTIIAGLYVIVRHYSNIVRLIKGTENKSVKKSKVPAGK